MVDEPLFLRKTSAKCKKQFRRTFSSELGVGWLVGCGALARVHDDGTSKLLVHAIEDTVQKLLGVLLLVVAELWHELPERIQECARRDDGPLSAPQHTQEPMDLVAD